MIRVLIIDDEKQITTLIKDCLTHCFKEKGIQSTIFMCNHPSELLNDDFSTWDLIVLDVEMPGTNGIELAKKIRDKNKNVIIVFITNYNKYIIDSYKVHAFDYISKPISQNKIDNFINDLMVYGYFKDKEDPIYSFKTTLGNINVEQSKILYFEYLDKSKEYGSRVVKMVTNQRVYVIRNKISSIYTLLDSNVFVIPHKSFIINFENVQMFKSKEIIMSNEERIPLSQKKTREIKILFHRFINSSFGG